MIIICPQCGFRRDVPDDRIPANAAMATCPHCRHRFYLTDKKSAGTEAAAPGTSSASLRPSAEGEGRSAPASAAVRPPLASGTSARAGSAEHAAAEGQQTAAPAGGAQGQSPASPVGGDPLPQGARVPNMTDEHSSASLQGQGGPASAAKKAEGRRPSEAGPAAQRQPADAASAQGQHTAPEEEDAEELGTPWDMAPERLGGIAAFYQTCLRVMFAAPYFFSRLNPAAPQGKALSFYLVVSVLQVLLERFWGQALASFLLSSGADDPQLRQLAGMLSPADNVVLTLLMRCAVLTIQLYMMSGIFYMLLRFVAPEKQQFPLVFQVVAYAAAPELLCIVPLLGSAAGMVWSVACGVVGLRHALRLNWIQAFSVVLPMYLLLIPVILQIAAGMAAM